MLGFYGLDGRAPESELLFLFVEPDAIGRGFGRLLWKHVVDTARGLGIRSFTIQSDPGAEPFYSAMGAIRIGERPSEVDPNRLLPLLRYVIAR